MRHLLPAPPPATSPDASHGAPFSALLATFSDLLPRWLRRFGVRSQDLADAEQEALVSVWQESTILPANPQEARLQILGIAARVAQRLSRHNRRREASLDLSDEIDTVDPRDVVVWVEARLLVLEALERLEPDAQALLVAHFVEGRSSIELALEFGETKDVIDQRLSRKSKQLRKEIDKLLGPPKKGKNHERGALAPLGLFGSAFDKAVFGALLESEGKYKPIEPPPPPESGTFPTSGPAGVGFVGPLLGALGALAAIVGVLLVLLWPRPSTPQMRPEIAESMRLAFVVGTIATSTAPASIQSATAPTIAPLAAPPAKPKKPGLASGSIKPKAEDPPTPEKLAKAVARAREVFDGVGPHGEP